MKSYWLQKVRIVALGIGLTGIFAPLAFAEPAKGITGDVPSDFIQYTKEMKDCFYRNFSKPTIQSRDVTVKFFLTEDGSIRDARIVSTPDNTTLNMACLDAVYCASPLKHPPMWRVALPPAPSNTIMAPNDYGSGVYEFTFLRSPEKATGPDTYKYEYFLIPREIYYRYPNVFSLDDLNSDANKRAIYVTPNVLEDSRFQWAEFYEQHPRASRNEISNFAKLVADKFLSQCPKAP